MRTHGRVEATVGRYLPTVENLSSRRAGGCWEVLGEGRSRTLESSDGTLIQNPDGLSGFRRPGRIFLPRKSGRMDRQNVPRPVRGPDRVGSLDWRPVLESGQINVYSTCKIF